MSFTEYRNLLQTVGCSLVEEFDITKLLFLCEDKIQDGNEQNIPNVRTLFKEMEANDTLGIDRLEKMKERLKVAKKWHLFKEVLQFEVKRKKYNDLLQQISDALDESIEMERLILTCKGKILEEREGNVNDTRSLFRELETQNNLEFSRVDILKQILNSVQKEDLLRKVEDFERWRNDEDESACKGGERAVMLAHARSLGGRVIGVLTMKTICTVGAAGITLLTLHELLNRSDTCEQLMASFTDCVLPAGTQLIEISQGCVCFTIKADNLATLCTLWNMYQDGTLKVRVKKFVLTEEMIKRAGGEENVEVTVTIEEDEYEKAFFEFIREQEGANPRRTIRRNSDSALFALPNEGEVALVKLQQLENAFKLQQERIGNLEKEVEVLPKLFLQTESSEKANEKGKDQDIKQDVAVLKVQEFVDKDRVPRSRITESSRHSGIEESVPGFEPKMRQAAASSGQSAWNPNDPLTEGVVYEKKLADDIGLHWKDLGRALGFHHASIDNIEQEKGNNSKECCIEVLVRWLRRDGKEGATAGKLAEALTKSGLQNLADRFPIKPSDTNRDSKENSKVRELEDRVSKIKELEEEVSKIKNKNKELEEENFKMSNKIKELDEEVSKIREFEEEDLEDKLSFDMNPCAVSGENDEEVRERRISAKLQTYKHQLATYVTSPLEVPEVKQDHLKTAVKLDILKTLSEHLEDLYIGTREMVSETCKCSEDLKREFYDFAYHGLRADHDKLVYRVKDLEDTVEEMGEEEKEELQKVKEFQVNRESLIKELEEKWRTLFSPPGRLPKNRWSADITRRGERSTDNKKVMRNTDRGARPKQRNVRDKRLQNPKPLSQTRKKKLKCLRLEKFDSQRLKES
ncbi:CAP-Gly domain-containing linker protein 1-like isoform X2 [Montipora foliosa]|uniref:CAP-Gly domain-containing linker protein 1-like isoform X2 n=1 Tax=Montipora foliosa TaxID=591990 RepID=UPI0035F11A62